jgi:hypothetical protein
MTTLKLKARVLSNEAADDTILEYMEIASMGEPICDGAETGEMSAAYTIIPGRGGLVFAVDEESTQYLWTYNHQTDAAPDQADIEAAIAEATRG